MWWACFPSPKYLATEVFVGSHCPTSGSAAREFQPVLKIPDVAMETEIQVISFDVKSERGEG